jgi:hypothetical protein
MTMQVVFKTLPTDLARNLVPRRYPASTTGGTHVSAPQEKALDRSALSLCG